ncbi:glycosyltransferase family 71 protein [Trematosphaeria pertusa]|uniref:Glycosyltransferase family 71 protein n=1 Tax=Trematosphaeria pertusa TaxID=390896 RepID=A0A6A6IJH5_9PLEO|nr:glycosyltransferase family 71 protein [Trematosphaeria pertusa]KAF2250745.1 glycosyltransferase family 71 protein [Trematosphaeria pertusa]
MLCWTTALPRLAIPLLLLCCSLFFLSRPALHAPKTPIVHFQVANLTKTSSTFDASVQEFWLSFAASLEDARPQCSPLRSEDGHPPDSYTTFQPLEPTKQRLERLNIIDESETALFRAHYLMRASALRLGPKLPFSAGTTGIVTTANPKYMSIFLVSLRMLRRTGCQLPVEVFISDWSEYNSTLCETVLPSLNARCVVLSEIYSTAKDIAPLDHFQYKIFSILFSSFQNALFLDSDAFPAHDPTTLFLAPPYTTHGLVTWPDLFGDTASSHYYHIAGIPEVPVSTRYSTESGQVLLDKSKHRESLLLMVYYNYYGPSYYYPLLCQGSHGAGDKDTFIHAAMAMGLPWYQVSIGVHALGRDRNGSYAMAGMAQADPALDFQYARPMPSHMHMQDLWQDDDLKHVNPEVEEARDGTRRAPKKPRPFFIHQNMHKPDPKTILAKDNDPLRDVEGQYQRMWGSLRDMVADFGYDVERRLWEVMVEEACREDTGSETCAQISRYVLEVFGYIESLEGP